MAIKLRRVRPSGWWYDALLLAAFAALTLALARGVGLGADLAVRDWSDGHRPPVANGIAVTLNRLGQGGALTLLTLALGCWLAWRLRSLRAVLPTVSAFVLTTGTILPLKYWLDRGFPHRDCAKAPACEVWRPEELFSDPAQGVAYPSGHVGNAIVWYGVLVLLLHALLRAYGRAPLGSLPTGLLRVLPPAIVFCTTTYLGYHWITDSIAGLLLGLLLDRQIARVPWNTVLAPAPASASASASASTGEPSTRLDG